MKITIIAASERRQRYKFLSVPLELGGHEVTVIQMRPLGKYFVEMFKASFARKKQDLVILMGIGPKGLLMFFMIRLRRVCVMVRLGGDPVKDRRSQAASSLKCRQYIDWLTHKINEILASVFLEKFDGVIVVNAPLKKRLSQRVKNKALQIFVVSQYCEGEAMPHDHSIDNTVELLTVTNLTFSTKAKGVIWIIEQLIQFSRDTNMVINYRVAGGGKHLSDIQKYLAVTEVPESLTVYLDGFVTELEKWYTRANIFLYHSRHDALPNVILESKKYGLPLMANDCEEFRAIVCHPVSGLLYTGPNDFQQQLRKLVEHEYLRESIGKAALKENEEKYSIRAVQETMENTVLRFLKSN